MLNGNVYAVKLLEAHDSHFYIWTINLCLFTILTAHLHIYCSEVSGDREVQRTMLELLNQLDGFSSDDRIKVGNHYIVPTHSCS